MVVALATCGLIVAPWGTRSKPTEKSAADEPVSGDCKLTLKCSQQQQAGFSAVDFVDTSLGPQPNGQVHNMIVTVADPDRT